MFNQSNKNEVGPVLNLSTVLYFLYFILVLGTSKLELASQYRNFITELKDSQSLRLIN